MYITEASTLRMLAAAKKANKAKAIRHAANLVLFADLTASIQPMIAEIRYEKWLQAEMGLVA